MEIDPFISLTTQVVIGLNASFSILQSLHFEGHAVEVFPLLALFLKSVSFLFTNRLFPFFSVLISFNKFTL